MPPMTSCCQKCRQVNVKHHTFAAFHRRQYWNHLLMLCDIIIIYVPVNEGCYKTNSQKSLICHVAQFYFKFLIFIFVDNATSSCGQFLIMWTMISITCHNSNVRIVVHHLAESCDSLFSQTFFCILNLFRLLNFCIFCFIVIYQLF